MEKLKIYSAYLPYGLKLQYFDDEREILHNDCKIVEFREDEMTIANNEYQYDVKFDDVKPILFSLEDLTKEITINGETFVPIIELAEIAGLKPFKGEYRMEFLNDERAAFVECKCFEHYGVKQRFAYYNDFGFRATLDGYKPYKQFELFEKLLEWKFNVFNLPEIEYIKVTEEYNPYD